MIVFGYYATAAPLQAAPAFANRSTYVFRKDRPMADREWNGGIKELGDRIAGLKVSEAVELGDYLEEVHKIKPAGGGVVMAPAAAGAGGAAAAAKPEEKTEFTVVLAGF